jgi:hypothetical protein
MTLLRLFMVKPLGSSAVEQAVSDRNGCMSQSVIEKRINHALRH